MILETLTSGPSIVAITAALTEFAKRCDTPKKYLHFIAPLIGAAVAFVGALPQETLVSWEAALAGGGWGFVATMLYKTGESMVKAEPQTRGLPR